MKLTYLLALASSLALGIEAQDGGRPGLRRPTRQSQRPTLSRSNAPMVAARKPRDAPARYLCTTGEATRERSTRGLQPLPSIYVARKREFEASRRALLRLRQGGADFYECPYANPSPALNDCQIVTDQVYSTQQTLRIDPGGCLVFEYDSCRAFFCALCDAIQVETDFIGNQLNTAETLCVADGNDASIVSETPPQWEAGFVYVEEDLPYYDVC